MHYAYSIVCITSEYSVTFSLKYLPKIHNYIFNIHTS